MRLVVVAEDVVQDVFLAVIQDAARYRPGRSGVLAWLLGIARNYVRRSRQGRPILPLPVEETDDGRRMAAETDPIGDLTRERHEAALSKALLELPRGPAKAAAAVWATRSHRDGGGQSRPRRCEGSRTYARALCSIHRYSQMTRPVNASAPRIGRERRFAGTSASGASFETRR